MTSKLTIVTSYADELEIVVVKDRNCPVGCVYFMPDQSKPVLEHLKSIYQAEKEMNKWIRKYDNVLNGLNYWKNKFNNTGE